MSTNQVILRNKLCFVEFEGVEPHFQMILNLIKKVRFYEALSTYTRIYSKKVEKFYLNSSGADGVIKSKGRDITLTYDSKEIGNLLDFVNKRDTGFGTVDTQKGLKFMGYNKKKPELKYFKKKEFPQDFKFLANIVGKCILCKDSTHDSISEL